MSALPIGVPTPVAPGLEAGQEPDIDYDALVTEDGKPVDRMTAPDRLGHL